VNIDVMPIPYSDVKNWLLHKHYARRMSPVSYSFGGYRGNELIGVVTFGTPSSSSLRCGICGEQYKDIVIELNRLCCENSKNIASLLVGRAIKLINKPAIIVSYADTGQGHIGYIYQATNFIYTGLSAKRTDWKIKGLEHLHGATIADKSRGIKNRAAWMREKYGDDFYLQDRPLKHRYVYFIGSKKQKKEMFAALKYPITEYPKGESKHYDTGEQARTQLRLL